MEAWDIYDIDRIKTGKTSELEWNDIVPGEYRMVVHICIFNSKNEMLIQQRQPFKDGWSNMWDITVGGRSVAGESSRQAARRELFEELGYKFDFTGIRPYFTINFASGFDDFYIVEADVNIDELKLQPEEVQQVKWASKDEILYMIKNGEFIPYYGDLIGLLFSMNKNYGAHMK